MNSQSAEEALLVLADGTIFEGDAAGWRPPLGMTPGELVFNTVMSGYQEVITDPSYAGQIVTFTYPHIGNYGANPVDDESRRPFLRGIVVRDLAPRPSSWRSAEALDSFLVRNKVPAITGIDTRKLTRHVREHGAMPAAFGTAGLDQLQESARRELGTDGVDLASAVTTSERFETAYADTSQPGDGRLPLKVVAYDFGMKLSILRQLSRIARVTVVPAGTSSDDVLALGPDGVFLSNGPGDPAALGPMESNVGRLVGRVPVFGICLGHQLLARTMGAKTYKLRFGHHGGNHPVRHLGHGRVEITSQNHNYAVSGELPSSLEVTHLNLNDGVVEGVASRTDPAFGVQYHPEAGPGPHDARYLFEDFRRLMEDA